MRCYFIKGARFISFQELPGFSCGEAVQTARKRFAENISAYDGVEVWSLTRRIYQHGGTASKSWNSSAPTAAPPARGDMLGLFKRSGHGLIGHLHW